MTKLKKYYPEIFPKDKLFLLSFDYYVGNSTIKLMDKINDIKIHMIFDGLHTINVIDKREFPLVNNISIGCYLLEDNEYTSCFHKQNYDSFISSEVKHYLISTHNEIISILADFEPEILSSIRNKDQLRYV